MPSLSSVRASNLTFSPAYLPVAVFIGGTSGIGRGIVEAFARYTKGNAHIIIIGRNRTAAESIIASLPKPPTESGWQHEFVACDASLMKNIGPAARDLLNRLPKINFLVISSGYLSMLGRNDTEEGIDHMLALRYYGRWKFIHDLLPALREANRRGEDAKAMSVLDPLNSKPVNLNDLGLKIKYSGLSASIVSLTYTDMAMEASGPVFLFLFLTVGRLTMIRIQEFALRDPDIAFIHICPGFVNTPVWDSPHWGMGLLSPLIKPLLWIIAVSPEVCAEHMLFGLFSDEKGFIRRDSKGDNVGMKNYFGSEEGRKKLWDHTVQESSAFDPSQIPSACQGACNSVVDNANVSISTCTTFQCLCTPQNDAAVLSCVDCVTSFNHSGSAIIAGQDILNQFAAQCSINSLSVSTLSASGAATVTGVTTLSIESRPTSASTSQASQSASATSPSSVLTSTVTSPLTSSSPSPSAVPGSASAIFPFILCLAWAIQVIPFSAALPQVVAPPSNIFDFSKLDLSDAPQACRSTCSTFTQQFDNTCALDLSCLCSDNVGSTLSPCLSCLAGIVNSTEIATTANAVLAQWANACNAASMPVTTPTLSALGVVQSSGLPSVTVNSNLTSATGSISAASGSASAASGSASAASGSASAASGSVSAASGSASAASGGASASLTAKGSSASASASGKPNNADAGVLLQGNSAFKAVVGAVLATLFL
ncbi:hypothetical protein C8R44DRAFT_988112 [Mycena epipterygia]|nr:hypothetical protein C8R44DRAFT_988112 [Mycena epipterygia]